MSRSATSRVSPTHGIYAATWSSHTSTASWLNRSKDDAILNAFRHGPIPITATPKEEFSMAERSSSAIVPQRSKQFDPTMLPPGRFGNSYYSQDGSLKEPKPEPKFAPVHQPIPLKKAPAKFALGGSCSSSEPAQSMETCSTSLGVPAKNGVCRLGSSSKEDMLVKSDVRPAVPGLMAERKQLLFAENRRKAKSESSIDSDPGDEIIDESAIEDDTDSSDWEDCLEDSGKSSVDETFFRRVESKANLVSRPSLITLMLAKDQRAKSPGNPTSQSTSVIPRSRAASSGSRLRVSPDDSDEGPLMMKGMRPPSSLKPIIEVPRSSAKPIVAPANYVHAQAALSPRTTRRNMLATELTESLRRHLLWERQQQNSTANAVLKRRHTSHDVANLKQYPDKPCMKQAGDANASSRNQYFAKDAFDSYHSKAGNGFAWRGDYASKWTCRDYHTCGW